MFFNLIIMDIRILDAIEKLSKFTDFNRSKFSNCLMLENCLKQAGNPSFNFYVAKDSKKLKWATLNGPQKHRFFKSVNVAALLQVMCKKAYLVTY